MHACMSRAWLQARAVFSTPNQLDARLRLTCAPRSFFFCVVSLTFLIWLSQRLLLALALLRLLLPVRDREEERSPRRLRLLRRRMSFSFRS